MSEDLRADTERELQRVVDRLTTMPLARAESASVDVHRCAEVLVAQGRALEVPIPADASLPFLGPQGLGPLIAVLGRDCLDAARAPSDLEQVLDALVRLRRALP